MSRKGFTPCPNFLWDIDGLNSKDRDVLLYLFSHSEKFIPSLTQVEKTCSFGERNTKQVKNVLVKIREILSNCSVDNKEFLIIKNVVSNSIDTILSKTNTRKNTTNDTRKITIDTRKNTGTKLVKIRLKTRKITGTKLVKIRLKTRKITGQEEQENNNKEKQIEEEKNNKKENITPVEKENKIGIFNQQLKEKKSDVLNMPEIKGDKELLRRYYEYFKDYLLNRNRTYQNYVSAFKNCIRADWGNIRKNYFIEKKTVDHFKSFEELETERKKRLLGRAS